MNNKNLNKYVFSFILCAIMASNSIKTSAEEINADKVNFELGVSCLNKNDYKQAIKYFTQIIQNDSNNIEAHYNLGLAYKKSGMTEESISEFGKVVNLLNDPQNIKAKGININQLSQENRILHDNEFSSDKYELYSKVKSQENDYIELGDMHYDNQQFETAFEYYNLAININPYNDYTYFKIAKSFIDLKNYLQAEPYIEKAIELNPQNPKYTYYKDLITGNAGNINKNNINLREKINNQSLSKKNQPQELNPDGLKKQTLKSENNPINKNQQKYHTNEVKNADKSEFPSNIIISNVKEPIKNKQNTQITTNHKKPDIKTIDQGNLTQGKSQELDYLDVADLHYDNQEYETAIEYYNQASKINPNNDYIYYKLARCSIDMKKYKSADEYIDKAISLSSTNKEYFYFKNQIGVKLNPNQNRTLAYKKPVNPAKIGVNELTNKSNNINVNKSGLKLIAEDPKLNSEDEPVNNDFDNPELIKKPVLNKKQNTISLKGIFNKLKSENKPAPEKIALKEFKNSEKLYNKVEKPKKIAKNTDIATPQTTPIDISSSSSFFGKDIKYYQTQDTEKTQPIKKIANYKYEEPLQKEPSEPEYTPEYYNEKGIEYFKRDNLEKAENFFKKAIELDPAYAKSYNNLANIEVKRDNLDKAIQYSLKALELNPSYAEPYYNLALIYKKKKNSTNEIAYLDKAIETDPRYYEAYFTRGMYYYNAGNYEQAKFNFKEVLKYKNDHYLASQNLGIIYANELNKIEAENYLKAAIRLNKDNPTTYYYLASIYQATGNNFDAMENFQKTIELDPTNYKALLALSKCYEQNDEIDRAIDTLKDAIQLNQSNAEPYNYMGLLYLKKDKYIEATNSFQKAIELNPNRSIYHYNLSQSYICLNMKNKAQMEFERAANTAPATIQDYIDLSEIFYDRSMPSYSIKVLKDGIATLPNNDYLYLVLSRFYEKTGAVNSAKKLLSDYLVQKPNGTLSPLIQRKLSSLEKTENNEDDGI